MNNTDNDNGFIILPFITEKELLEKENIDDIDSINLLITKKIPFNKELYFDANEYIYNIYKSYKMDWSNIKLQLYKDFNRLTIYINKIPIFNTNLFRAYCRKYRTKYYITKKFKISYYNLLVMLSTQSTFYFPYLYGKSFENIFRKLYKNNNLYVVQGETKTIHYNVTNDKITYSAILTLLLKDVNTDKILSTQYIEITIHFNMNNTTTKEHDNVNSGEIITLIKN